MTCWDVLDIAQTSDRGDIRRAYAARLKATNPEDDAEGFKQLRTAYEQALSHAERGRPAPSPPAPKPRRAKAPRPVEIDNIPPDSDPEAVDYTAHTAALNRLQACLRPGADAEALIAAYDAVVHSPAMASIDVRSDTEDRVAWLLSRNIPRSDPVIDLAVDAFHWDSRDTRRRPPRTASHILQRQKDVGLLRALSIANHPHHKAFKALSAPPRPITVRSRLSPTRPEAIAAFLSDVVRRQPSLRNDLNADTIAAWQTFLARPHLATWGLWALMLSGPALIAGLLCLMVMPQDFRGLGIFTTFPPIFALAALVYTFGVDWPQRRWREIGLNARAWQRWGWGGAMGLLMLATALPVGGWVLTAAVTALSIATALWIVIVGEPDMRPGKLPWLLRAFASEVYLGIWTVFFAFRMQPPQGWRIAVMLGAVMVACVFAPMPLYRLWAGFPSNVRRLTALGLAAIAAGVVALLWGIPALSEWQPAMVAMVATIVLLHRAINIQAAAWLLRLRSFGFVIAVVSVPSFATDSGLAAGGTVILLWVVAVATQVGLAQRAPGK